jgi:hypothetical protein
VNGAQALAIEMHDAMVANGFSSSTENEDRNDQAGDWCDGLTVPIDIITRPRCAALKSCSNAFNAGSPLSEHARSTFLGIGYPNVPNGSNSQRSTWLRLYKSELLCDHSVEHPRRKKPGQSPVLEALLNDCIACLRFCCAECDVDSFAQTLRR